MSIFNFPSTIIDVLIVSEDLFLDGKYLNSPIAPSTRCCVTSLVFFVGYSMTYKPGSIFYCFDSFLDKSHMFTPDIYVNRR